jgi:hypothetical protein
VKAVLWALAPIATVNRTRTKTGIFGKVFIRLLEKQGIVE